MTELKKLRIEKQLTQQEAARRLGVSLRSYIMYENNAEKEGTVKYRFLLQEMQKINTVDEEHGILTLKQIQKICKEVFDDYKVEYCYLFGSYAKGTNQKTSDIDFIVKGVKELDIIKSQIDKIETLKRIDIFDYDNINNPILKESMDKYGKIIY